MITTDARILLCTNGRATTRAALDYGVWLASRLQREVLLLGVVEERWARAAVEALVSKTELALAAGQVSFQRQIIGGKAVKAISDFAHSGHYLTVVGPLGRPLLKRWFAGRSFRRLIAAIPTPLLYVPQARIPLRRILLCMGGLGYASSVEHFSLYLSEVTGASITVLHVVEPVTFEYPTAREIQDHWQDILDTDTPQGRNLRKALAELEQAGVEVTLRVRQGNVVHEILEEVRSEDYDLVAMGSPHSTQSLRHLFTPNVTAEVAEVLKRPVLTVRFGHELVSR